jgi:hypothetical protein
MAGILSLEVPPFWETHLKEGYIPVYMNEGVYISVCMISDHTLVGTFSQVEVCDQ